MKVKVSQYIANRLVQAGIRHVFMVTGGVAMHLNDSLGKHPGLEYVCNHHEQACAIAAESYARLTSRMAAVCVTSGPGGTNALTGVLGAWFDSVPMIVISGQVRYDTTVRSTGIDLRQLGDQEFDIVKSIANMTKYAVMVTDPAEIRYHLDRALYLATHGRPGPSWIDVPVNVQGAMVEENEMLAYDAAEDAGHLPLPVSRRTVDEVLERIRRARRPVLLAGSGIRSSCAHKDFLKLIDLLNVPVVTAWNAHDCLHDDHPLYFGRPGSIGERAGNFIVQNSDLLLVLGCRLNIRQISYNWKAFARSAFKIVIDIDSAELKKPTVQIDLPIHADVADFIRASLDRLCGKSLPPGREWLDWCRERQKRYPVVMKEYWDREDLVNPYCFVEVLSQHLPEGQITVTGDGTACVCTFQGARIKPGQRLYTNSGCAAMGYDLPAAIGSCIAAGRQKVVCLAGDGSLQFNIQELQTVVHYRLPLKIFVLNNDGYHSIRQTQQNFFGTPYVGCDVRSGISFPDMQRIAGAYGIPFNRCRKHEELDNRIAEALEGDSPFICEVMLTPDQPFAPKLSSRRLPDGRIVSKPLEDLYPFLSREEFRENMVIPPLAEAE
ncbi:MAG: thiamine pyrophosphate-binding protein [Acidobacteria bacterium]|nr:thiamine pyrophosphate-binding protein [Acidobacteriota bacterium]